MTRRRLALTLLLLAAGCSKERTVQGGWYELRLPEGWVDRPRRTAAEESAAEGAWKVAPPQPLTMIVLARPVPFAPDARTYASTQGPGLALLGLKVGAERDGKLGALDAWVVDAAGRGTTVRYWYFVRDGMAVALQCSGERSREAEVLDTCSRVAGTFRVTGALPKAAAPPVEAGPPVELTVGGYRFKVPAGWAEFNKVAVPNALFVVRASRMVGRHFPSATLVAEPWTGDLEAYDRMGEQQEAARGVRMLSRKAGVLLGEKAYVVESVYPPGMGGHRAVLFELVQDGRGLVLTCAGDPDQFAPIREACDLLAGSLARVP